MIAEIYWNVDPIVFTTSLFGQQVQLAWYGLCFAAGLLMAQQMLAYVYKKEGRPSSDTDTLTMYMVVATVVGARLGHYLFYEWETLVSDPGGWALSLVLPPFAGLASHGAVLAMLLALVIYSRTRAGQPFFWVLDRLVVVAPIGAAMIRLGNLFNSEIYGTATSLPWGFVFMRETDPSRLPLVPRHPTQLYEAVFYLALLPLMWWLWSRKRTVLPSGFISGVFIFLLFTFRFLVEFLKLDQKDFEAGQILNMGQLLSLPLMVFGLGLMLYFNPRRAHAGLSAK